MTRLFAWIGAAAARLRVLRWPVMPRDFLVVFTWHQVTPRFDSRFHHRHTWTALDMFRAEVETVARRFTVLPLHDALRRLKEGTLQGGCAALSFDDGDASLSRYVVPLLRQLGLPATLFVNTAYLGGSTTYWFPVLAYFTSGDGRADGEAPPAGLLQKASQLRTTTDAALYQETRLELEQYARSLPELRNRLVSAEWLAGLDREQFAIGAHGHEHQRYALMSPGWQRQDLALNLRLLAEFPAFRPLFAVPFGRPHDWTGETLRIASELGLETLLSDGGINRGAAPAHRRIPSDGRRVKALLRAATAEAAP